MLMRMLSTCLTVIIIMKKSAMLVVTTIITANLKSIPMKKSNFGIPSTKVTWMNLYKSITANVDMKKRDHTSNSPSIGIRSSLSMSITLSIDIGMMLSHDMKMKGNFLRRKPHITMKSLLKRAVRRIPNLRKRRRRSPSKMTSYHLKTKKNSPCIHTKLASSMTWPTTR